MPAKGTDIFEGTSFREDGTEDMQEIEGQELTEVEGQEEESHAPSRDDIMAEAMADGEADAVIEELSSKESVTIADLRRIPGTDKLSDTDLTAMWARYQKGDGQEEKVKEEVKAEPVKRGYKIYDDKGSEVVDLSKLTAEQFLAMKFGYQALDKEQKKSFEELVRNASLGHYNESKQSQLIAERNKILEQLKKLEPEHKQFSGERQQLAKALEAFARGDDKPIKKLAADYVAAMSAQPATVAEDPQEALELERAGMTFYYETLIPQAYGLAQEYGANPQEVAKAIQFYLEQEPEQFRTREKYEAIIKYEVPQLLESNGYARKGEVGKAEVKPETDPRDAKIAELEKKLNGLSTTVERTSTRTFGKKAKSAPGAGGGITAPAGETMPSFKNREEMKAWLRS